MTEQTPNVAPMPISDDLKFAAVKNEYHKTITFGGRQFELKDLGYDDYVHFIKLSAPLVEAAVGVIQPVLRQDGSEMVSDLTIDTSSLDVATLAELAGHNLPVLAHLVLKQSDRKITLEETKILSMVRIEGAPRGPLAMLEVVLKQVAHNQLIEEFVAAFPRLGSLVEGLVPSIQAAVKTVAPTSGITHS